jgi:hypothetical protein
MSTTVACRNCDRDIDSSAKFCIYCGTPQVGGVAVKGRARPITAIERAVLSNPLPLEALAFVAFGVIAIAILWSMYGRIGTESSAPPPPPVQFVPPKPKPAAQQPSAQAPAHLQKPPAKAPEPPAKAPPGKATVTRWSDQGTDTAAMMAQLQSQHPNWQYTYKTRGKNYFVVSGYEGDQIFYQKTLIRGGKARSFLMKYPRAEKAKWQKANEALERKFR